MTTYAHLPHMKEHAKREYTLLTVPRARRVYQPFITTLPTAIMSFLACMDHVTMEPLLSRGDGRPFADVLILNGPGTCLVLCAAVYVNKVKSWIHPLFAHE